MAISPEYALFEPLSKRPEATTLTIRDLLRKFLEGKIRIPSSALGDLKRLNRWLRDTRLESDALQERVEDAQQRYFWIS